MTEFELKQKFPKMSLVKSPPTLMRVNGCGVAMYGKRDYDSETNTYVATWCISLVLIPILGLRAYRVMKAPSGGWYFIGREPVSTFVKVWNLALILGIAGAIGGVQYNNYTSSPEYRAKAQMTQARKLTEQGKLADAARIYQSLVLSNTPETANATVALKTLLDGPCQTAALSESAGVVASATQVARRGPTLVLSDVIATATKLAATKGDADPPNAIAILDTVRPLVIDPRAIDEQRFVLLGKWVEKEPANVEAIVALASILESKNKLDEAKKILLPIRDKLGDGEGARVLGMILGRQGDDEGAYALLWPYVKTRLDKLHDSEQSYESTLKHLWAREVQFLKDGKASQDFYEKYKTAGTGQQDAMVEEYINSRTKNDPSLAKAQESLEQQAAVVPVALELGIVMLQRAQAQTDTAVRQEQLKSTEEVFLAVGGVAGQSDVYRLSLGQVYYWLGKQAEGRKLFDDYLAAKGRKYEELMAIAIKLRQLGSDPEARSLMEEAFNQTSVPGEKSQAAMRVAAIAIDLDDQITWLNKADPNIPEAKARLASLLGDKAVTQGNDTEAARQYQITIDTLATLPRSPTTLNQTALAYYSLYATTGDHQAFDRSADYFQQAVTLEPSDTILLYNAGVTLLNGALADVIGSKIDLRLLHQSGTVSLLSYLYNDPAGREELMQRVKSHPGVARAMSYFEKGIVLAPKNSRSYAEAFSIYRFTRDEAAMKSLEKRAAAANIDSGDQVESVKRYLDGSKDQTNKETYQSAIKRNEAMLPAARAKGGPTAAVAISTQASILMALQNLDDSIDTDRVIALTSEAHKFAPSLRTHTLLMAAHSCHAIKTLCKADPEFDAYYRKNRRMLGPYYTLALALDPAHSFSAKVSANADVQKIVEMLKEEARTYPDSRQSLEWAVLKQFDANEARSAAETILKSPRMLTEQAISNLLEPASVAEALDAYWLMQIHSRPNEAKTALDAVAKLGIPVPLQP